MPVVSIDHIEVDERGVARIAGSRIKVIHLVMDKMANGWDVEEIQRQHPHLSLGQVHAAFAFYYDHRADLDEQIRRSLEGAEAEWEKARDLPGVKKIRAAGYLP
jgi:uncharacterized protein (DUF433 family)